MSRIIELENLCVGNLLWISIEHHLIEEIPRHSETEDARVDGVVGSEEIVAAFR